MPKRIAILGSTGSIGTSALDVIAHLGPPYQAVALSAHRQADKLLEQVRRFGPAAVCVSSERPSAEVMSQLRAGRAAVYQGPAGLVEMVGRDDIDMVLAAIVGAAGLPAVLAAVRGGKALALANKEALVVAGALLIPEARRRGTPILPVDSEHSAVFQAMQAGRASEVRRVILTASGGPFRGATRQQMESATIADALNHPTWRMGNKISIDSATMFNKALEIIEACWLFDLPPEKVGVVIHPESIVHSMVEFIDGSVIAQLSPPDMRTPIQYALTYPGRLEGCSRRLDIGSRFAMHFEPPDPYKFPAIELAYRVARAGGTMGAVLNAANEVAVRGFLDGRMGFGRISEVVRLTIDRHTLVPSPSLADLMEADRWARQAAESIVAGEQAGRKPALTRETE